jgi:hypothetical protein
MFKRLAWCLAGLLALVGCSTVTTDIPAPSDSISVTTGTTTTATPALSTDADEVLSLRQVRLRSEPDQVIDLPLPSDDELLLASDDDPAETLGTDYETHFALSDAEMTDGFTAETMDDDGSTPLIATLDQLYGQSTSVLDQDEYAKWAVFWTWSEEDDETDHKDPFAGKWDQPSRLAKSIYVSEPLPMLDANDHVVANAYSFKDAESTARGLIVLTNHTRGKAVPLFRWNLTPPATATNGWLFGNQIFWDTEGHISDLDGKIISNQQFTKLKAAALAKLWDTPRNQLMRNNMLTKQFLQSIEVAIINPDDFFTGY